MQGLPRLRPPPEENLGRADGDGGGGRRRKCEVCWRACARVRDASGGQAGSMGDRVSACSDGVRAGTASGGGGASQEKSKGWGDGRVTKEEEVLPGWSQILVNEISKST